MKIYKLKIKAHGELAIEKVVVETDIPQAVQSILDKVSKFHITNITLTPLGDMPDNYVAEKFLNKKVIPTKNSGSMNNPPF